MTNRRFYRLMALTAVLGALALAGSAMAGDQVPFKGKSSGVVQTVGFNPVTGTISTHATGTGEATHLGKFTLVADVTIQPSEGFVMGTYTLTAANGDKLFLTMSGHGVDPTHGAATFTIVEGTGRFLHASGQYDQLITFGLLPGTSNTIPYTEEIEGTISFKQ
jgi:hypothetical protein